MANEYFAYDSPYTDGKLRPCSIERAAPASYAPDGAYIIWRDVPLNAASWIPRGAWVRKVFRSVDEATR